MQEIVITSAARTAIGAFNGGLASVPASELGKTVIEACLQRADVSPADVSEVILGQVLTGGAGQNPARQAAIASSIPVASTAVTINQVCGSGLRAIAMGCQAIANGDSRIVVAGGQENMSQSPHLVHMRNGQKLGDKGLIDSLIKDGLQDAFEHYHMGITAEQVAEQFGISREQQDHFAVDSQRKAYQAQQAGYFDEEIVPVTIRTRKGEHTVSVDEHLKPNTDFAALQKLRPAFQKEGSVTAGNASGINDGAAAVTLMSAEEAKARHIEPLAKIVSWATRGVDPSIMGTGPIPASLAALEKAGWSVDDLDLIEANEAFAAQACAVNNELKWDTDKVNVNGGAIALGHPIGASGARVLVTLLYEMRRRNVKRGLATLCIGGGMGIALCVER